MSLPLYRPEYLVKVGLTIS